MTPELTAESLGLRPEIDFAHLQRMAAATVAFLDAGNDCVQITLEPGDATAYKLMIVSPEHARVSDSGYGFAHGDEYVVTLLNLNGRSYPWAPRRMHAASVMGNWTENQYTATMIAAFLTLLHLALDARP